MPCQCNSSKDNNKDSFNRDAPFLVLLMEKKKQILNVAGYAACIVCNRKNKK